MIHQTQQKKVLANFNGQIINNLLLKLNWVNSHNNNNNNNSTVEKYSNNPNQKYTVKFIYILIYFFIIDLCWKS